MPQLNSKIQTHKIIALLAPAGVGKTVAAASASEFFTLRPVAERTSMIELSDILYLQFDRDGVQSLHSFGLDPFYLDFSSQPPEAALWVTNVIDALKKVKQLVIERNIKWVITDSFTSLTNYLTNYYLMAEEKESRPNGQRAYGRAERTICGLLPFFKDIPANQIWLMHAKSAYIDPDKKTNQVEAAEAQKAAMKPGDFTVDMGLAQGVADKWIRPLLSAAFPVIVNDKGERQFVTQLDGLHWVKNRLGDTIPNPAPANIRGIMARHEEFLASLKNKTNQ